VEELGLGILNGSKKGDEEGELTFVGKLGTSVIDYVICNAETWEEIENMKIADRTESDHRPIELTLEATMEAGERKMREREKEIEIEDWTDEGCSKYRDMLKERKEDAAGAREEWEELTREMRKAIQRKKIKKRNMVPGRRTWWDKQCRESKTALNKLLREFLKDKIKRKVYNVAKQEHKKLCKMKQEEERKKEQKKLMEIKDRNEVFKYVKKQRQTRENPDEEIGEEEWIGHFMRQLDGEDSIQDQGEKQEERGEEGNRREGGLIISKEEIGKAITRLKKKKAAGEDNIRNEAWIYADEKTKEKLREVLQKICDEKKIPAGWREGWIFPIYKKGDRTKTENYRGITLMDTGYKILTMILEEKLRKEVERLNILPETQAGFRKGRSCIDNIYILKTVAECAINLKKGRLFAFFADLRAAFDKVNRQKLWKEMREYGIEEKLIEMIEAIYEETSCRIKIGEKCTRKD